MSVSVLQVVILIAVGVAVMYVVRTLMRRGR